jgi:hypothetical protein
VAKWQDDYQIDGIDLDIEGDAGEQSAGGPNMVHFIRKLKALKPGLLVSQPAYESTGPLVSDAVINASWNVDGTSNGLADIVGIMYYEGTKVKNCSASFLPLCPGPDVREELCGGHLPGGRIPNPGERAQE